MTAHTREVPHEEVARVLLVDEDVVLRSAAAELLERAGCEVAQACSGHEALAKLSETDGQIDALVTNAALADMDGVMLAYRAQSHDAALAVVIAADPGELGLRARQSLGAEVVPRLYLLEQLVSALSAAVARRRLRRAARSA
jgi:DNA-binding NtrC family response regulator